MNAFDLGQNNSVKLKGCPHCGSAKVSFEDDLGPFAVQCDECKACGPFCETAEIAISAWNRRHDETPSEFERLCGKENSHV